MSRYLKKIFNQPLHVSLKKAAFKFFKAWKDIVARNKDQRNGSYYKKLPFEYELTKNILERILHNVSIFFEGLGSTGLRHYVKHRFDLLGSGWVQVRHGMMCRGLEGYRYDMGKTVNSDTQGKWLADRINSSNLVESQRIWQMIDSEYLPIDWHIDFKSGYRWSEKTWYKDIKFGHKLGIDIKVPWELARMQHLPQMGLYYHSLPKASELRKSLQHEFRNQVLDFIATNPPRFGVNWACAMDVSIRAANWIMTYNLFHSGGVQIDHEFEAVLSRSIYEHGLHIISNLEWYDQQRGNHYLADISGLAFIAAHLPSTTETDAWLAFAVQELTTEVGYQFYPDGGNIEGSTAYHRLSAEMVYYITALILGLPQERREKLKSYYHKAMKTGWGKPMLKPGPLRLYKLPDGSISNYEDSPFPPWYFDRMERMAEFIMDITKPNGHIPQIGDNDSGRFFKLGPKYERMTVREAKDTYANLDGYDKLPEDADYFMENHLDCSHLVAGAYGLFDRKDFAQWLGGIEKASSMPDCVIIQSLAGRTIIGSQRFSQRTKENNEFFTIGTKEVFQKALSEIQSKPADQVRIIEFPIQSGDLCQDLTLRAYPDFGLYMYKSPRIFLTIRCWEGKKPFHSVHMHEDQLSFELMVKGHEIATDPGTYCYTPLPMERLAYRIAKAHYTPCCDEEPDVLNVKNVFTPCNIEAASIKVFGKEGLFATVSDNKNPIQTLFHLKHNEVRIYDYFPLLRANNNRSKNLVVVSTGYGIKYK